MFGRLPICVTIPCMRPSLRHVIIVLLCCLLPVQGALAFVRSVGMASHHAQALQAVALVTATDSVPGAKHPTHHNHHQAHQPGLLLVDKSEKPPAKSTLHSQASCTDCAKCCLAGAAAPPPNTIQPSAVSFVLSAVTPVSVEAVVRMPENPERPPRAFPPVMT